MFFLLKIECPGHYYNRGWLFASIYNERPAVNKGSLEHPLQAQSHPHPSTKGQALISSPRIMGFKILPPLEGGIRGRGKYRAY
jgi:hypothetical protein